MNFLDNLIVNTATAVLRGALAVGTGSVYAQIILLAALLLAGGLYALYVIVKTAFFEV